MAERNDDLYNIRQRMQLNRDTMRDFNGKYLDLQVKQNELTSKLAEFETTLSNSNNQKQLTYEDFGTFLSEWCSATLQPILNELCGDLEQISGEMKEMNMKIEKLEKNQVQIKVEDDVQSNVGEKKVISAGRLSLPNKKK